MNYFELFEIPISLKVNADSIKKKFYELSRKYHPDFFSQEHQSEQEMALEMSALLNNAFKTFSNPDAIIEYVLQLKGLLVEGEKYDLPPHFLMDMLELNEELTDAKMAGDIDKINQCQQKANHLSTELYESIEPVLEHYQEGVTTHEALLQVKAYYYQKKYISRILANV